MYQNRLFYFKFLFLTTLISISSSIQAAPTKSTFFKLTELKDIGIPTFISLAALGMSDSATVDKNFKLENQECAITDNEKINKMIFDKKKPGESEKNFNDLVKLLKANPAIKESGLNENEIKEAINLVTSGEFNKDFISSVSYSYKLNKDLPLKLIQEVKNPQLTKDLIKGMILGGIPDHLFPRCSPQMTNLLDSKITGKELGECAPDSINKILTIIYKNPTTSDLIKTIRIFTNKDNRSARAAAILYAKMHGFDLSHDDINKLDKFLDTNSEADLSPLISAGVEKLYEKYKVNDAKSVIEKIKARDTTCSAS